MAFSAFSPSGWNEAASCGRKPKPGTVGLKAIVLAQEAEIENLKLLVLKLKRMHFGAKSEKLNGDTKWPTIDRHRLKRADGICRLLNLFKLLNRVVAPKRTTKKNQFQSKIDAAGGSAMSKPHTGQTVLVLAKFGIEMPDVVRRSIAGLLSLSFCLRVASTTKFTAIKAVFREL